MKHLKILNQMNIPSAALKVYENRKMFFKVSECSDCLLLVKFGFYILDVHYEYIT